MNSKHIKKWSCKNTLTLLNHPHSTTNKEYPIVLTIIDHK